MSAPLLIGIAAVLLLLIALYARALHRYRQAELPPLIFPVRYVEEWDIRPSAPTRQPPLATFEAPPNHRQPSAADASSADGATVEFHRLGEEPVQLLPGRLEIEEGSNRGQEIRFVRMGGEPVVVTLGRGDGPPYHHVKLPARTVSRQHARMQFEDGCWRISNLSRTNPTVVNGEELADNAGSRVLSDGDTIEMGEMVFRFRMS